MDKARPETLCFPLQGLIGINAEFELYRVGEFRDALLSAASASRMASIAPRESHAGRRVDGKGRICSRRRRRRGFRRPGAAADQHRPDRAREPAGSSDSRSARPRRPFHGQGHRSPGDSGSVARRAGARDHGAALDPGRRRGARPAPRRDGGRARPRAGIAGRYAAPRNPQSAARAQGRDLGHGGVRDRGSRSSIFSRRSPRAAKPRCSAAPASGRRCW